ncbi:MAG: glycosyltransferase [Thermoleophilia bacterium]|nr:glycosyltransferase [Thermoleophilia bacterium]
MEPDLSYCVVNNDGRDYLLDCLAAIERHGAAELSTETIVLDNASTDGSADAVRERYPDVRLIELESKVGKAENDSTLMKAATGRYCLLLNEDSELRPGAAGALYAALEGDAEAAAAGAQLFDSDGNPYACAWRFPGVETALIGAVFLHGRFTVESQGELTRRVDWGQSSALMVRREAAEKIGYLDPQFFVYYDECDFCKRLDDNGWHTLYVPSAEAIHHNQLSNDLSSGLPRIVEFHRNRDLYMKKHHSKAAAFAVRLLTAWTYGLRTVASLVLPGAPTKIYAAHTRQALFPYRGEGLADRAKAH